MLNLFKINYVLILSSFLINFADLKGGRGGGGGFRGGGGARFGGGSRFGSGGSSAGGSFGGGYGGANVKPGIGGGYNYGGYGSNARYGPGYNGYRSGGGIRWSSFGAGMLAYGVMSNLASRGYYHGGGGYYHRNSYGSSYREPTGSFCVNNEDFNGTVFGTFRCPLPEFDPSATYCCGSADEQTQYCCKFFDDNGRKTGVIIAIISVIGFIVCSVYCVKRLMKRRNALFKFENRSNAFTQPPMNMRNINRNINTGNPLGPRGPQPNRPLHPQNSNGFNSYNNNNNYPRQQNINNINNNERAPFIPNQMNQSIVPPQPVLNSVNAPPPSYNEAILKT